MLMYPAMDEAEYNPEPKEGECRAARIIVPRFDQVRVSSDQESG
jgi:hypothetical protein